MLKSMTVNYETRDFFRNFELRSDTKEDPSPTDVHRAFQAVKKGSVYVHFNYADGQSDCVYADGTDIEGGTWTFVHTVSANSKDDPVRMKPSDVRNRVRSAIKSE